jgi:hypothetical protein
MTNRYVVIPTEGFLGDVKRSVLFKNRIFDHDVQLTGTLLDDARLIVSEISSKLDLFPEGYADVTKKYRRRKKTRRLIYNKSSVLFNIEGRAVVLIAMIPNKLNTHDLMSYQQLADEYVDAIVKGIPEGLRINGETIYFDYETGDMIGEVKRDSTDIPLTSSRVITSEYAVYLTLVGSLMGQRLSFSAEKASLLSRKLNLLDANNLQLTRKLVEAYLKQVGD